MIIRFVASLITSLYGLYGLGRLHCCSACILGNHIVSSEI